MWATVLAGGRDITCKDVLIILTCVEIFNKENDHRNTVMRAKRFCGALLFEYFYIFL